MCFVFFHKGSSYSGNGWIELVLIEARDLVAADLRGTSDPYVRVQYGNLKRRTKVLRQPNFEIIAMYLCWYVFQVNFIFLGVKV